MSVTIRRTIFVTNGLGAPIERLTALETETHYVTAKGRFAKTSKLIVRVSPHLSYETSA